MYSGAQDIRAYSLRAALIQRPEMSRMWAEREKPATGLTGEVINGQTDILDARGAVRMCLEASRDLPPFEACHINAADTLLPGALAGESGAVPPRPA
jgi:hypothetical protein